MKSPVDTLRHIANNHSMNEKEYRRLKKGIQDDHRKKLEALDLVWQLSNNCPPPKPLKAPIPPTEGEAVSDGKSKAARIVEEAVDAAGEQFSTKEIARWIVDKLGPGTVQRSTISHSLRRMKAIDLVKKGMGKSPSIWRKVVAETTPTPEPSTPEQAEAIRSLIKTKGINAAEFKEKFLVGRYGVDRLASLTRDQAESIFSELESQPETKE